MKWIAGFMLLAAAGCASPARQVHRMYLDLHEDVRADATTEEAERKLAARQHERVLRVREICDSGPLEGAQPNLEAAVILVASDELGDLLLAEKLAIESARLGEDLGFRVAAEAVDKLRIKQGQPQRYGTQYAFEPALGRWRLYPCDPATTDAERRAMGVPSLAELEAGERELNERGTPARP